MTSTTTSRAPIGEPVYGIGLLAAYGRYWRGYVAFSGKASRGEYWWPMLVNAIIGIVLGIVLGVVIGIVAAGMIANVVNDPNASAGSITAAALVPNLIAIGAAVVVTLPFVLPSIAVMCRRLRDAGFPPLLALLCIVGLGVVPMIMCALPTKQPFAPAYGQPGYGQPAYGQPGYGQPAYGQRPGPAMPGQGGAQHPYGG